MSAQRLNEEVGHDGGLEVHLVVDVAPRAVHDTGAKRDVLVVHDDAGGAVKVCDEARVAGIVLAASEEAHPEDGAGLDALAAGGAAARLEAKNGDTVGNAGENAAMGRALAGGHGDEAHVLAVRIVDAVHLHLVDEGLASVHSLGAGAPAREEATLALDHKIVAIPRLPHGVAGGKAGRRGGIEESGCPPEHCTKG